MNEDTQVSFETQKPPKTWLVESILVSLFCCLPFGIAGIVNASRVESRFFAKDYEGAIRASQNAKKWTIVSFAIGFIIILFYGILGFGRMAGH
ncbi:MAG: CD225/dispanin family protein [Bacteroidales bacterium]|nr:CD225/dispanin family protein [Bacteroidales bacterium]